MAETRGRPPNPETRPWMPFLTAAETREWTRLNENVERLERQLAHARKERQRIENIGRGRERHDRVHTGPTRPTRRKVGHA